MPERMRLGKDFRGGWSTFAASSGSPVFVHADAPLTPAEAMARCPEVAALVTEAQRHYIDWDGEPADVAWLASALAPFTTS